MVGDEPALAERLNPVQVDPATSILRPITDGWIE